MRTFSEVGAAFDENGGAIAWSSGRGRIYWSGESFTGRMEAATLRVRRVAGLRFPSFMRVVPLKSDDLLVFREGISLWNQRRRHTFPVVPDVDRPRYVYSVPGVGFAYLSGLERGPTGGVLLSPKLRPIGRLRIVVSGAVPRPSSSASKRARG